MRIMQNVLNFSKSFSSKVSLPRIHLSGDPSSKDKKISRVTFNGKQAYFRIINPDEHIQRYLSKGKFYESQKDGILKYIGNNNNYTGGVFVDIGSCIGNHSIFFSVVCQAEMVFSFEPVEDSYRYQIENIKLNKLKNIKVFNFPLGENDKEVGILKGDHSKNIGMARIVGGKGVLQKKLDNVLKKERFTHITLIKIDVEGYNDQVIKGSIETLKKYKPDIFIECSNNSELITIQKFLNPLGYITVNPIRFNSTPTYLFKHLSK